MALAPRQSSSWAHIPNCEVFSLDGLAPSSAASAQRDSYRSWLTPDSALDEERAADAMRALLPSRGSGHRPRARGACVRL